MQFIERKNHNKLNNQATESDLEMLKRIGIRFFWLFLVLLNFDTLFDWFLGLMDLLFEYLHVLLDIVEYTLEVLIDEIFSTGHYVSEIIMVNSAIVFAIYQVYRLYEAAPRILRRAKRNLLAARLIRKRHRLAYWRSLNLVSKIKFLSAYSVGGAGLIFWLTL